ncbi:hypothetical protein [Janthinobacterium sp. PAMC25594]|uniref:hypothetical protein n=1 Tax=Janthinobacterium sp. PAMC25594 TaxID=2861284 RepID=UPI001C62A4A7|nr:hypothetical protein [Janthinobacterium sp. PAMC25594]QYG10370.1 hypothetical protein KY494_12030 [Janthinobacterium sp. PAMC25594]
MMKNIEAGKLPGRGTENGVNAINMLADALELNINLRRFPNAVSFGPAMPHAVYRGHAEDEFITEKQLLLNLQIYGRADRAGEIAACKNRRKS